jgi:hypothetical protein
MRQIFPEKVGNCGLDFSGFCGVFSVDNIEFSTLSTGFSTRGKNLFFRPFRFT